RHGQRLSSAAASYTLRRSRDRQAPGFLDEQLCPQSADHCPTLQVSLASGIILQMDQTTSAHQSLLWYVRKRREDTNLDCHQCLCVGSHCQKRTQAEAKPERYFADLEHQPL